MFDRKAVWSFILFEELVVGREDIGPVAGDNAVDPLIYLVFVKRAFETLVPALRFDLALGVDFGRTAGGRDVDVNGRFALFRYFGLLAEENHVECRSVHGCMGLEWLNVCSIEILRRKTM